MRVLVVNSSGETDKMVPSLHLITLCVLRSKTQCTLSNHTMEALPQFIKKGQFRGNELIDQPDLLDIYVQYFKDS